MLAEQVEALGAEAILLPTIELAPPSSFAMLNAALEEIAAFDWVVFTSANAVHAFAARAKEREIALSHQRMAVIGPATGRALTEAGISGSTDSVLLPKEYVAESLAEALLAEANGARQSYLLVRAEEARDVIPASLEAAGHRVVIVPVYRNVVPPGAEAALRTLFAAPETRPHIVTFTSSSTARNLFALLDAASVALPGGTALASIGPITSATLRELGYEPTLEAAEPTIDALAAAIHTYLREARLVSGF
jgi:uroporphyrinogen-III synthase